MDTHNYIVIPKSLNFVRQVFKWKMVMSKSKQITQRYQIKIHKAMFPTTVVFIGTVVAVEHTVATVQVVHTLAIAALEFHVITC